jgi:hypothetical protein
MLRPRTQRKPRRPAGGGGEGSEAAAGTRRLRPQKDGSGLDQAYRRSYLQQDDAKRPRHD